MESQKGIEAANTPGEAAPPPPPDVSADSVPFEPTPPPAETAAQAEARLDEAAAGLDALPEQISDGKGRFTPEANSALDTAREAVAHARDVDPGLTGPLPERAAALEGRIEDVRDRGREQVHDDLNLVDTIEPGTDNIIGRGVVFGTNRIVDFANGAAAVAQHGGREAGEFAANAFTGVFGASVDDEGSLLARGANRVEDETRSLLEDPGGTVRRWGDGVVAGGRQAWDGMVRVGEDLDALRRNPGPAVDAVGEAFGDHVQQAYREHGAVGAAGVLVAETGLVVADAKDVLDLAKGLRNVAGTSKDAVALADEIEALGRGGNDVAALKRVEGHLDDPEIAGLLEDAKRAGEAQPRQAIPGVVASLGGDPPLVLSLGNGRSAVVREQTLEKILPLGGDLNVRRSNGAVEEWQIKSITGDRVVLSNDLPTGRTTKAYDAGTFGDLAAVNPDLVPKLERAARAEAAFGAPAIGEAVTIGRGPGNDVDIRDLRTVSRDHATVERLTDLPDGRPRYVVRDSGSTNGTIVQTPLGAKTVPSGGEIQVTSPSTVIVGRSSAAGETGTAITLPGPSVVRQRYDPANLGIRPSDIDMPPSVASASFERLETQKHAVYDSIENESFAAMGLPTENGQVAIAFQGRPLADWYQYRPNGFDERNMTGIKARLSVAPEDAGRAWDIVLDVAEERGIKFKMATPETLADQTRVTSGAANIQDGKTFTLYHAADRTGDMQSSIDASTPEWTAALQEISDRFEDAGIAPHAFADPRLRAPLQDVPIEGGFEGISWTADGEAGREWQEFFGFSGYVPSSRRRDLPNNGPLNRVHLGSE